MKSILLVDSETTVAAVLQTTLRRFGFEVEVAESGDAAHRLLEENQFDLILIEFDLTPRTDAERPSGSHFSMSANWSGPGLIRELRAAQVTCPILVHTVFEGEPYETASLDAGADDFIVKRPPISLLLSRLHAHLRRRERDLGLAAKAHRRIRVGRFTIDREARILLADEKPVSLSNREIRLLEKLAASPERIVSSEEILNDVWGDDLRRSPLALASSLKRLRQKMEKQGLGDPVENIRGRGFKLSSWTAPESRLNLSTKQDSPRIQARSRFHNRNFLERGSGQASGRNINPAFASKF